MANVIPMAGEGSRFREAGYVLPKPLIPISGKPMIVQVIRTLPPSDRWIFLVREEHIKKYAIDALIRREVPRAIIIPVGKTTEGQASTCMLAIPHLKPDEEMIIAACDNSFVYDAEAFERLKKDPTYDAVIWTFTRDNLLTQNPTAWGWVRLKDDGRTIDNMSVKVPVSDSPYDDHAVVATFYFKKAREFQEAYELMKKEDFRINNEFYVDAMPMFYKKLGLQSAIFDVDLYVGWGKPSDVYAYQSKEYIHTSDTVKVPDDKDNRYWREFFNVLSQKI
jgi:dTDP-glucose pyrophosphorylase